MILIPTFQLAQVYVEEGTTTNLDSALTYINRAQRYFRNASKGQQKKLEKAGLTLRRDKPL